MSKNNLSAVILTFNEELHIKRCIESLLPIVDHVYVLDSYSTDSTLDIVSRYDNVSVLKNKFVNHAAQFNHALDSFNINSEWVIRVDADEYIDEDLRVYLKESLCKLPQSISGVYLNRHITFMKT
ncbi:TPA: glycosyltransferase [Vibrio parahaemolyticus]|nr:glycosyltransferase [Vibrio parahaemolyticus]